MHGTQLCLGRALDTPFNHIPFSKRSHFFLPTILSALAVALTAQLVTHLEIVQLSTLLQFTVIVDDVLTSQAGAFHDYFIDTLRVEGFDSPLDFSLHLIASYLISLGVAVLQYVVFVQSVTISHIRHTRYPGT